MIWQLTRWFRRRPSLRRPEVRLSSAWQRWGRHRRRHHHRRHRRRRRRSRCRGGGRVNQEGCSSAREPESLSQNCKNEVELQRRDISFRWQLVPLLEPD